jgi:hypothetical protein
MYEGLRFWAKGTAGPDELRVQMLTSELSEPEAGGECELPDCSDHYGARVVLTPAWKEYVVLFDELEQEGWGSEAPLNLEHALNFEFKVDAGAMFDVWVDQISFY